MCKTSAWLGVVAGSLVAFISARATTTPSQTFVGCVLDGTGDNGLTSFGLSAANISCLQAQGFDTAFWGAYFTGGYTPYGNDFVWDNGINNSSAQPTFADNTSHFIDNISGHYLNSDPAIQAAHPFIYLSIIAGKPNGGDLFHYGSFGCWTFEAIGGHYVLASTAGQLILNDIANWNYINILGFGAGQIHYTSPAPGLFESTGNGIRIATDSVRGAGEIMSKEAYQLAGTTVEYTWSGNAGTGYMQIVLGQFNAQWLDDPGVQNTSCVRSSFGSIYPPDAWLAQPDRQYKTSVAISAQSYQSTTIDVLTGQVMESSGGNFDFSVPLRIFFRQGDVFDSQNAYLILADIRIGLSSEDAPPVITNQPRAITVTDGNTATFSVGTVSQTPVSYQWYFGSKSVAGANGPTVTINNAQISANGGNYSVVVGNQFGSVASQPAALTILSNLDANSVTKDYSSSPTIDPSKDSLIYIVHGRTPPPVGLHDLDWMGTMASSIAARAPLNWAVATHAWTQLSAVPIWSVIQCAEAEGKKEGDNLVRLAPEGGWKRLHLIAHSAGAKLVEEIATKVRAASNKNGWNTEIQITLLDPYTGVTDLQRAKYGVHADWTENYFDFSADTYDVDVQNLQLLSRYGRTDGPLPHAHNVDVTAVDPNASAQLFPLLRDSDALTVSVPYAYTPVSTHSFPIYFYQATVPPSVPYDGTNSYGFALSDEGGGLGVGNVGSYPLGNDPAVLLKNSHSIPHSPVPVASSTYSHLDVLPSAVSSTGTTQISSASLNLAVLGNSSPGSNLKGRSRKFSTRKIATINSDATGSPAWISFAVNTQTNINYVSCDVTFNGSTGSSGFVTVYWNDQQMGVIDEDFINSATETYTFEVSGAYLDRNNCLGFRLDPFSTAGSNIVVTNVTTGFAGIPQPPTFSIAGSSTTSSPVITLTGAQGNSFLIQASDDLASWFPVANVSLIDGSSVQFTDQNSSNFTKRFYRAVSP